MDKALSCGSGLARSTHGPILALYIGAGFAALACIASFSRLVARNEV